LVISLPADIFVGVQGIYSAEKGALQAKNAAVCYDANGFNVHILYVDYPPLGDQKQVAS
jgi:hypothetical protein